MTDRDVTLPVWRSELWEDGERVITGNGRPMGSTLGKQDAQTVLQWLQTATDDLVAVLAPVSPRFPAFLRNRYTKEQVETALKAAIECSAIQDAAIAARVRAFVLARLDTDTPSRGMTL